MHSKKTARVFRLIRQDIFKTTVGLPRMGPIPSFPAAGELFLLYASYWTITSFPVGHGSIEK
jgi:hypothetical protein